RESARKIRIGRKRCQRNTAASPAGNRHSPSFVSGVETLPPGGRVSVEAGGSTGYASALAQRTFHPVSGRRRRRLMMRQMREATKPIMLFTALAFVALMVFEWGMDATGRSGGSVGEIGSVNGDPVM